MRTTSILLSLALAFKTIYSKAIDINTKIVSEQLNVPEEDNSYELVKSEKYNFIYKFHCQSNCDEIKNDLEFAFNATSNAFEIYQPIVFEVFAEDLTSKYGFSNNVLAEVLDTNYVPLKTSKSKSSAPYLYPQALAKQLKLNKQPKYKKNDFIMLINTNSSTQQSNYADLRSLVTHEIFHGLGFYSLTAVAKLTEGDANSAGNPGVYELNGTDKYAIFPYTVPSFNESLSEITNVEDYMTQLYDSEISKFMPFSVFDKNIISLASGEKLFDDLKFYYKEVNQKCSPKDGSPLLLKESTIQSLNDCFESLSPETQEAITRIIEDNYFKSHAVGILTKDGDAIPLQTGDGTYSPGSSVSHTNNPIYDEITKALVEGRMEYLFSLYDQTTGKFSREAVSEFYDENYLLYAAQENDLTVEEMMEFLPNNQDHPLIGDGIVKIMKTLGWTEKGKRRSHKTYYLDESLDIPEATNFQYRTKKFSEILKNEALLNKFEIETTNVSIMEEEPTSPVDEEEETFPADEIETTLPVNEDEEEETFPADEIETTLPVNEEEEEETIPIGEDEVETVSPVNEDEEEEQTFPADEIETTLPVNEEEEEEEETFPTDEVETVSPVNEDEEEEETFPADEIETTLPVNEEEEEEETFPTDEVETVSPVNEDENEVETFPADEVETTLPVDEEKIDVVETTLPNNAIEKLIQKLKKLLEMLFH